MTIYNYYVNNMELEDSVIPVREIGHRYIFELDRSSIIEQGLADCIILGFDRNSCILDSNSPILISIDQGILTALNIKEVKL